MSIRLSHENYDSPYDVPGGVDTPLLAPQSSKQCRTTHSLPHIQHSTGYYRIITTYFIPPPLPPSKPSSLIL